MLGTCIVVTKIDISLQLSKENKHQASNLLIATVVLATERDIWGAMEPSIRGLH